MEAFFFDPSAPTTSEIAQTEVARGIVSNTSRFVPIMGPPDFSSDSDSDTNSKIKQCAQENRRRRKQQVRLNNELKQLGFLAKDLAEIEGGEINLDELYSALRSVRITLSQKYLPQICAATLSKMPEQAGQDIMESAHGGMQSARGSMQSAQGQNF